MSAPTVQIAKPHSGVLPLSAVDQNASQQKAPRQPIDRTKVALRRLPPGLTDKELVNILGDEWKPGSGKISWFRFSPGKISKEIGKPSTPACAFFQFTDKAHLPTLSEKVQQSSLVDARGSSSDSALAGPPTLAFSPYPRVPATRRRNDARQGSIDQDPELIEFLESLTTSVQKPRQLEASAESTTTKESGAITTPLIEALRGKKAAKEKAAENKNSKPGRQSSKGENAEAITDKKPGAIPKSPGDGAEKKGGGGRRSEKPAPKENVKAIRKDKALEQSKVDSVHGAVEDSPKKSAEPSAKKQEPASPATAAARMIQRDLGIRGGRGGGAGRRGGGHSSETQGTQTGPSTANSKSPTSAQPSTPDSKSNQPSAAQSVTPNQKKSARANEKPSKSQVAPSTPSDTRPRVQLPTPSTGNSAASSASSTPTKSGSSQQATKANLPTPPITPGATKAFLKHANPSQGITEPLIEAALTQFGTVAHVEIDKRKGFAYVDFTTHEGLRSAVAAGSVPVAQGSVMVLERKDRVAQGQTPPSPAANARNVARGAPASGPGFRGRRGGGRGGRGGRGGNASAGGSVGASE